MSSREQTTNAKPLYKTMGVCYFTMNKWTSVVFLLYKDGSNKPPRRNSKLARLRGRRSKKWLIQLQLLHCEGKFCFSNLTSGDIFRFFCSLSVVTRNDVGKGLDLGQSRNHYHVHLVDNWPRDGCSSFCCATPCWREPKSSKQLSTVAAFCWFSVWSLSCRCRV